MVYKTEKVTNKEGMEYSTKQPSKFFFNKEDAKKFSETEKFYRVCQIFILPNPSKPLPPKFN